MKDIDKILDEMTLEQQVGQLFMANVCGGENLDLIRRDLETFHFGGLQYSAVFQRFVRGGNYLPCGVSANRPLEEDAAFMHKIKEASREIVGVAVIVGGDQEGGLEANIYRRRNIATMPSQMGLGASGDPEMTYWCSLASAYEVKALGLDMLYGPSLDVNTNPLNPEIGTRSFSDDPVKVAEHGAQVIRAYREAGVISNAKHFPGRGHGQANAHHSLESIDVHLERLHQVELLPFRKAIEEGVDSIMMAHTWFPALDKEKTPASLSRNVITGLLREEMGFEGVIIPDTLTMFAISKNYAVPDSAVRCLQAGSDMIFMKVRDLYRPVVDAILKAVRAGTLPEEQLRASVRRILNLKAKIGLLEKADFSLDEIRAKVGCEKHTALARKAAEKACVLHKNKDGLLPFDVKNPPRILVVTPRDANIVLANDSVLNHGMLSRALKNFAPQVDCVLVDEEPTEIQSYEVLGRACNADCVVFGVYSAGAGEVMRELYATLVEMGKPVVAVITGSPYLATALPEETGATVLTLGLSSFALEHVARVLFGQAEAGGTLPVKM